MNKKKLLGLKSSELGNHMNAFFCQKFIIADCCTTWDDYGGVSKCNAMLNHTHTTVFPQPFKDLLVKIFIDNL